MGLADIFYPHDPTLVIVSLSIAVLAGYVSMDAAEHIRPAKGLSRAAWLAAAGLSLGGGIWAMHFVAILALALPVPVTYRVPLTVLSGVVAVLFATAGIYLVYWRDMSWPRLLLGGVLIGCGVAAMHYIGMAAISMPARATYEPLPVALSVAIAVTASTLALWVAWLSQTTIVRLCGSLLGLAIAGMHYTGIAAYICTPTGGPVAAAGLSPEGLAPWVAGASSFLLWNILVFAGYHRRVEGFARDREVEAALTSARAELARFARVTVVGELTASIAHEINQPLGAIAVNAGACRRWLSLAPPDIGEAQQAADRIMRDAGRAAEVIQRIRTFLRKETPETAPLDLNEIVGEVLALARGEIESRRIAVRTELTGTLPRVVGDRVAFQQVLLNLVMNAIEAMAATRHRARELLIRTQADGAGRVLVTVQDSGPGLGAEAESRIFDPFFTTKPGGMGVGLWISRSIVEAHGGRLWASPASPVGSSFQFTLPVASAASAAA